MSELDVLMEELTGLEDLCEEEKVNENEEKQVDWTRSSQGSRFENEVHGESLGRSDESDGGRAFTPGPNDPKNGHQGVLNFGYFSINSNMVIISSRNLASV